MYNMLQTPETANTGTGWVPFKIKLVVEIFCGYCGLGDEVRTKWFAKFTYLIGNVLGHHALLLLDSLQVLGILPAKLGCQ